MIKRTIFVATIIGISILGIILAKNFSKNHSSPTIAFYTDNTFGQKEDEKALYDALKEYDIQKTRIIENPHTLPASVKVTVFFAQEKFDKAIAKPNDHLKIALRLLNPLTDNENPKIIGVFEENKATDLLDFIETILPNVMDILLVFDPMHPQSQISLEHFKQLAAKRKTNLHLCPVEPNRNLATLLKETEFNVKAVIVLPSPLVLKESEQLIEHFKQHKIPIFANHIELLKSGALAGFCYDTQELASVTAESIAQYLELGESNTGMLAELIPQLHVNMDTLKILNINLSGDTLDEIITLGSADL